MVTFRRKVTIGMSWKWIRVFLGVFVVMLVFIASVFPIVLSELISNSVRNRLDEISDMPVDVSIKFRYPNLVIAEKIQWQQHNFRVSLQKVLFRVGFDLSRHSKGVRVSCDQGLGIIEVSDMEYETGSDFHFYRLIEIISETIERLSDVPVILIELSNLDLEFKSPWVSEKMKLNSEFQQLRTDSGCRFAIQLEKPGNQVKLELHSNTRILDGSFQWMIQKNRVHGYLEQVGKLFDLPALALIEFPAVNFKFNVPVDSGSELQFETHLGPLAFEMSHRFYQFKELKAGGRISPSNNSFASSLEVHELQAGSLGLSEFKAEINSKGPEGWVLNFEPAKLMWDEGDLGTLNGILKIPKRAEGLSRFGSFDGEWKPSGGSLIVDESVPISIELEEDKLRYSMKLPGMRQSPLSTDAGITGILDLTKLSQSIHSTGQIDFVDLLVENVTKTLQRVEVEYALSQSSDSLKVDLVTRFINHSFVSVLDRIWKITGDAALSLKRSSVSYPITANFSLSNATIQSDLIDLLGGSIRVEAEIDDSPEIGLKTSGFDSTAARPPGFDLSRLGGFSMQGSVDQMQFDAGLEVVGLNWMFKSDSAIPVDHFLEAEIQIDQIGLRGMNLDTLQISAQGIDENLVLSGSAAFLETPIQFSLKVPLSEGLQFPDQFDFQVPRIEYDQSSFSEFSGISKDWFLAGNVSLIGNYRSPEKEGWQSESRVHLHLERWIIPEKEIVIQDLESKFKLSPDSRFSLNRLKSVHWGCLMEKSILSCFPTVVYSLN
ncbi:MAG TPA: hypothetical protein EYQ50_01300 [Verrucomicrobiales bacterium]|nr:hypothetical protein [Verrucomicrobiales bacterium]